MNSVDNPVSPLTPSEMEALETCLTVHVKAQETFGEFMDNAAGGFLASLAAVDPPLSVVRADRERAVPAGDLLAYAAEPPEYPGMVLVPRDVLQRFQTALRVSTHRPHDQAGEPVEGFPVCSVCGAIQTAEPFGAALDAKLLTALGRGSLECSEAPEHHGNCSCHCHSVYRLAPEEYRRVSATEDPSR